MVKRIKPIEFYIEGVTLREALKSGLVDSFVQRLEGAGIRVRFVALILDPVGEPGLIRIGHKSRLEAERGGLHISLDPDMSDRVIRALETLGIRGEQGNEHGY